MQFQARIFVKVSNPGARIASLAGPLIIGALVLAILLELLKLKAYQNYCWPVGGLGLLCGIVGRMVAKGNMYTIGLSDTDLVVDENGIHVGNVFFPHAHLTDLDFWIEGYDGMPVLVRGRFSARWKSHSGTGNKVHFRAQGTKYIYHFYLSGKNDKDQLGQVFRDFYARQIPFYERNGGGPTFLFQQVRSKSELAELKKREGYV